jgi:hypothetical protein
MQVLAVVGRDAKRLLHQAVGLVSVAVWAVLAAVTVAFAATRAVVAPRRARLLHRRCKAVAASLALHFSVSQEAARHSACAPALAICPAAHSRFSFVPHED